MILGRVDEVPSLSYRDLNNNYNEFIIDSARNVNEEINLFVKKSGKRFIFKIKNQINTARFIKNFKLTSIDDIQQTIGKTITLYPDTITIEDKEVNVIRIKIDLNTIIGK